MRQSAFTLRRQVAKVDFARGNRVLGICVLQSLEGLLSTFPVEALESLADKEYHSQTLDLCRATLAPLLAIITPAESSDLARLKQLLNAFQAIGPELARKVESKEGGYRFLEEGISKEIERLAEVIAGLESLVNRMPDSNPEVLPEWEAIVAGKRDVVRPYKNQLFLFKSLILVAKSDGKFDDVQRDYLLALIPKMGFTEKECWGLIQETTGVRRSDFTGSQADAEYVVAKLYQIAGLDGGYDNRELSHIGKVGNAIGLDRASMERIANSFHESAPEVFFLDTEGFNRSLRQIQKLPRFVLSPDKVTRDVEKRVRLKCGFNEENFLLVFEARVLGMTSACAMLGEKSLVTWSERGIVNVEIANYAGFQPHFLSVDLILKNSEPVRQPAIFKSFFEIVDRCIRANMRWV